MKVSLYTLTPVACASSSLFLTSSLNSLKVQSQVDKFESGFPEMRSTSKAMKMMAKKKMESQGKHLIASETTVS